MADQLFYSVNPFTGETIASHPADRQSLIEQKISSASKAFESHLLSLEQRCALVNELAKVLETRKTDLARRMAEEMGKPITQGVAEIEKCADMCRTFANLAPAWLQDEVIAGFENRAWVRHDPIGVVLGIMPWNFPFWQVIRFAVPAILAGNTALLKHASNVCGCAKDLVDIFNEAGTPKGYFDALFISGAEVSRLISDDRIAGVSLTGSEYAGSAVGRAAGEAIKPVVLELGGSNAFIVCENADLTHAVDTFVKARFLNTGQSCIAAKRLLLHTSIHDAFVDALTGRMQEFIVGDPLDANTFIGPMARADLAQELHQQLEQTLTSGARCVLGGSVSGALFTPALVMDVQPGMPAFTEETFGPLVSVTKFNHFDEAIALSNDSRFGLGVSIFTSDPEAVLPHIGRFNEGAVFINDLVYSHALLPFGGTKKSGVGRELARDGLLAFVNRKTVVVAR